MKSKSAGYVARVFVLIAGANILLLTQALSQSPTLGSPTPQNSPGQPQSPSPKTSTSPENAHFLPKGKNWLDLAQFIATATIAAAGLWIACLQYNMTRQEKLAKRALDQLALVSKVMTAARLGSRANTDIATLQDRLENVWVEGQHLFGMHSQTWMALVRVKNLIEKLARGLSDPSSGIDVAETRKELEDAAHNVRWAAKEQTGNEAYLGLGENKHMTSDEIVDMVFGSLNKRLSEYTNKA